MTAGQSSRHLLSIAVRGRQIGNVGFNPEERLIARGKYLGLDIATLRVTPEKIAATSKTIVRGGDGVWPPPPNAREVIYFGGFPGREREHTRADELAFGLHSAMVPLTDLTDYQLCCSLARSCWVDVRGLGLPPVGYRLGGISGEPRSSCLDVARAS